MSDQPAWHIFTIGNFTGLIYRTSEVGIINQEKARDIVDRTIARDINSVVVMVHPGREVELCYGDDLGALKEELDKEFPGWTMKEKPVRS